MAKVLRPIGHEDRLSIVDHLDELRTRLIICLAALSVAFAVCFWQNHALLDVLNRALPENSGVTTQQGLGRAATQADAATAPVRHRGGGEPGIGRLAGCLRSGAADLPEPGRLV